MRARVGVLALGVALGLARGAAAQQSAPLPRAEAEAQKRERAVLLSQVFQDAVRRRSVPALAPVEIGLGLFVGVQGVRYESPLFIASGATLVAGGAGFYLVSERHDYELIFATMEAGLGLLYLAPLSNSQLSWQVPVASGHFVTSALGFLNLVYSTQPGKARLREDWRRVRTPAGRYGLSEAELQRIEQDLYATDPFVPNWLLGLPTIVGGLVGAAALFDGDIEARDKNLIGFFSGMSVLHGTALALVSSPADQYRSMLERAGLWAKWVPAPGGVSVVGGFD